VIYLWGRLTEALIAALTGHDLMTEPTRTRLIQIGEMAGPILKLPPRPFVLRAWRSWAAAVAASRRQLSSRRSRGCGNWPQGELRIERRACATPRRGASVAT